MDDDGDHANFTEGPTKAYRINCVDSFDHIVSSFQYHCVDDLDALDTATKLCAANGVEVWDGARRVVWMHRGGEARVKIVARDVDLIPSPLDSVVAALAKLIP